MALGYGVRELEVWRLTPGLLAHATEGSSLWFCVGHAGFEVALLLAALQGSCGT